MADRCSLAALCCRFYQLQTSRDFASAKANPWKQKCRPICTFVEFDLEKCEEQLTELFTSTLNIHFCLKNKKAVFFLSLGIYCITLSFNACLLTGLKWRRCRLRRCCERAVSKGPGSSLQAVPRSLHPFPPCLTGARRAVISAVFPSVGPGGPLAAFRNGGSPERDADASSGRKAAVVSAFPR